MGSSGMMGQSELLNHQKDDEIEHITESLNEKIDN
jgi:hypothetical protein